MPTDIAIILVNYSQSDLTTACLDSINQLQTDNLAIHTVLVDNGSPDAYKLPKRLQKMDVSLLRSDANLGFTGGNNMGIHAAIERFNSEFVILLNNDTTIAPDSISQLIAFAQSHPEHGLVSPKIYFYPGNEYHLDEYAKTQRGRIIWYAGGTIDWRNLSNFHRGVDELDRGQFDQEETSDFATGCCLLIKREVLEKVGLLDKAFFLYYEDADWCERAKSFGYSTGFAAKASVWHHNAGSSQGAGSIIHQYYQNRNRLLFFWKHGNWRARVTVGRLLLQLVFKGSKMERKAGLHFMLRRFGKQPIT